MPAVKDKESENPLRNYYYDPMLKEAVEELRSRFPYFYIRPKIEGEDLEAVSNPLPVLVAHSNSPCFLGSKKANYHLIAFHYFENLHCLEMNHALTDGAGMLAYLKSVLFVYLSKKTGIHFDPTSFRLPGSPIPESETGDPFAGIDFDAVEKPLYVKQPTTDFVHLKQYMESGRMYFVELPEAEVMAYCHDHDGGPNALMAVLLSKAMRRYYPNDERTFTVCVAVDHKAILGNHENYRMFANAYEIDYPKSLEHMDVEKLYTLTRGSLMLQADPENSLWYLKKRIEIFEQLKQMPLKKKMEVLPEAARNVRWSAAVSYVNSRSFGPLDPYIDEFYNLVYPSSTDFNVEITCINQSFFLGITQSFCFETYFHLLLKEFETAGIPYILRRQKGLLLPGLEYEDLE